MSPIHLAACGVEKIAVFEELARETTENEDILVVSLHNATSLSIWEVLVWDIDQSPFASILVIELFDRIDVLTGLVGDTTESINISVTESTGAVIVSSDIEVCNLQPQVDITVVHLAFELRLILLFSGSSYDDEFFSEPTSRVTMSWMLHLISLQEFVVLAWNDLVKIVQALIVLLVITTSYEIELTKRSIHALEIVRELVLLVDSNHLRKFVLKLDLEDLLRIFLEEMDSA